MTKPPVNSLIRFRSTGHEATVIEHTARGFKYRLAREYPFIPRWGMSFAGEGEVFTDHPELHWHLKDDIQPIEAFSPPISYTYQTVTYTK